MGVIFLTRSILGEAEIVFSKEEVYQSDVVKNWTSTDSEIKLLKRQQLISIQLETREKKYFQSLLEKNITSML